MQNIAVRLICSCCNIPLAGQLQRSIIQTKTELTGLPASKTKSIDIKYANILTNVMPAKLKEPAQVVIW